MLRPLIALVLPGFVLLGSLALALTYRVDTTGGSPALEEEVAAAIAAWQGEDEVLFEALMADDATTVVAYGQPQRFGPDLHSLTVSQTGPGVQQVRVLVNPSLGERRQIVLLHEIGILAGLPESGTGIMNPRLSPDSPAVLTAADRSALVGLQDAVPEDLNRDGVVDFYDLVTFARAYGRSGVNLAADINRDGTVDRADLELLREAYTFSPPSERPPVSETGAAAAATLPPVPAGEDEAGDLLDDALDDFDDNLEDDPDLLPEEPPAPEDENGGD